MRDGRTRDGTVGIGIIGTGNISGAYMTTLRLWDHVRLVACADVDLTTARGRTAEYGGPPAVTIQELLDHPEIEIIVNLTPPAVHGAVGMAVLEAGKSLFNEKPLALDRVAGRRLLETADAKGLLICGAPDTFLGAALQAGLAALAAGAIGEPVGAAAFTMRVGPEGWHPNPAFFFQPGAGPLFDLAVYHLTTLVTFLGPIARVAASTRITPRERVVGSGPLAGVQIDVTTPTWVTADLEFRTGLLGTLLATFDARVSELPHIEIYGADGTLALPDPTEFGRGVPWIGREPGEPWEPLQLPRDPWRRSGRGIGVAEMSEALRAGTRPRTDARLPFHVLDVMSAILESSEAHRHIEIESTCERPDLLSRGWYERGRRPTVQR